ncbi:platelet endothelial aggregation receptor 1-like [Haliotis asinina]|uniref:platelet endothelial aggregation receptor 1-like n=1 Tax=Haliotis asinina TaxID=109174 RepID=UPI0035319EF9
MGRSWMGLLLFCVIVIRTDAECHCASQTACAVFPSTPCSHVGDPDRCQAGWFGSYCQKQNIALRRPCIQSTTLNAVGFGADRGVDGTATTFATPSTCTHTETETNPIWAVSLNTSVPGKIQHIRLYLRQGFLDRNQGMEILVDSQMCCKWSSTEHPPAIANVTCRQPMAGTTVTIRIPGSQKILTLCEVQIFVCSDGWFSEDCDKQCHCLSSNDVCDKITGRCSSGCFPGYHGASCQTACPAGSFGINCTSQCGNCLSGVSCHKTTGTCAGGCAAGWMRDDTQLCRQPCQDGFYGTNCASQCGNCFTSDSCDKKNGTCPRGCAPGWVNDGTCLHLAPTEEGFNWGVPVAVVLSVLLIFTVIGATIYIRRLLKQLESTKKTSEEHYVTLDGKTKVPATESIYEHITNATP